MSDRTRLALPKACCWGWGLKCRFPSLTADYGGRSRNQYFDRLFRYSFFLFNSQKWIVFLYIGNEKDEKEINNSTYNDTIKNKIGVNLIVQDIAKRNWRLKRKDILCPWIILHQIDPQIQCNPYEIEAGFFSDQLILKFIWKLKGLRIDKTSLKTIKLEDSHLLILKFTIKLFF